MQFNEIEFYEKVGKVGLGMYLPWNCWVEKRWFDLAWRQIATKMPTLDKSKEYTMRSLCGEEFWGHFTRGVHIKFGRCKRFFVDEEMLPVYITNSNKISGPHIYSFL